MTYQEKKEITLASHLFGIFCLLSQSSTSSTLLRLQDKICSKICDPAVNIFCETGSKFCFALPVTVSQRHKTNKNYVDFVVISSR